MRKWILRLALFTAAFLIAAAVYGYRYLAQSVPVATAFFAKTLCSAVFVSGREQAGVLASDLALDNPLVDGLSVEVDHDRQTVSASMRGLFENVAVHRPGLGCTLAIDTTADELRAELALSVLPVPSITPDPRPWPDGDQPAAAPVPEIDMAALQAALDDAFAEPDAAKPRRTRAVVVTYDGQLVAERYAPGFDENTALLGWSMSKSLTNTLLGILVAQGRLDVHAAAPVPEWRGDGDPRGAITVDHLLRMSSGLEFVETYGDPQVDVQLMLFRRAAAADYAAAKPLSSKPDDAWSYSSGTSNILSRIVRQTVEEAGKDYWSFPRRELFDRLGIRRFVIEPDASGTFVGSSYSYAPARDWARLGLLYLRDGVWNGQRILPPGWVEYSTTPTPLARGGRYGAHFWLNAGDGGDPASRRWPELPADVYFMSGFEGQSVTVAPSKKAVIVRLGMSKKPTSWDRVSFLVDVLAALPDSEPTTD